MNNDLVRLLAMVRLTLTDPSEATGRLLAADVPRQALPILVLLVSVITVILTSIMVQVAIGASGEVVAVSTGTFFNVIVSVGLLLLTAGAFFFVGRMFGGTGTWPQSLLVACWLQVMQIGFTLVLILTLILLPPFAVIVMFGIAVLSLYVASNAVAVLHGFQSRWKVLLGLIVGAFVLVAITSALQGGMGGGMPSGRMGI